MDIEEEKLRFYSENLLVAIDRNAKDSVWRSEETADNYWAQVIQAAEYCQGYAGGLLTRISARKDVRLEDLRNCSNLEDVRNLINGV